jgi:hypothetical protein
MFVFIESVWRLWPSTWILFLQHDKYFRPSTLMWPDGYKRGDCMTKRQAVNNLAVVITRNIRVRRLDCSVCFSTDLFLHGSIRIPTFWIKCVSSSISKRLLAKISYWFFINIFSYPVLWHYYPYICIFVTYCSFSVYIFHNINILPLLRDILRTSWSEIILRSSSPWRCWYTDFF